MLYSRLYEVNDKLCIKYFNTGLYLQLRHLADWGGKNSQKFYVISDSHANPIVEKLGTEDIMYCSNGTGRLLNS